MAEKEQFTYALDVPVATIYTGTLITAKAFKKDGKDKGEPKFGATFLFKPDHQDWRPLKMRAADAAKSMRSDVDLASVKWPWANGDALANAAKAETKPRDREFYRGFMVLRSRSIFAPVLAIRQNGIVELKTETAKLAAKEQYFYDGVLCGAQFNFKPYSRDDGGIGVTAYLNMVLSTGEGVKIQMPKSGPSVVDVFKSYAGRSTQVDPGVNAADEF